MAPAQTAVAGNLRDMGKDSCGVSPVSGPIVDACKWWRRRWDARRNGHFAVTSESVPLLFEGGRKARGVPCSRQTLQGNREDGVGRSSNYLGFGRANK
jgi:hypothetical protein